MDLTSNLGAELGLKKNRKLPTSKGLKKKPLKQAEKQCYIPKCQKIGRIPDSVTFPEEKTAFAAAEIAGVRH